MRKICLVRSGRHASARAEVGTLLETLYVCVCVCVCMCSKRERGRELHSVVLEFQPTLAKVRQKSLAGRGLLTPVLEQQEEG